MSLYLGNNLISGVATPVEGARNIGQIVQSTIPLTDAGLHLLDGSLVSSGSYADFVTYIAGLVSGYPNLFTTEANWQSAVTTYGVCGKFVYDSTNQTVRLPKITGIIEGTTDVTAFGDLVEAGLPNITGMFAVGNTQGPTISPIGQGAFVDHGVSGGTQGATWTPAGTYYDFDASRSSSIYGNSTTVQPQSIKVLYYIVIATSVKTQIEVDIDEIATDLNGKADIDLSNITSTGTSLASGWSMPSSRYMDLTLGASGSTYTAPANGWVWLDKATTSAQFITLQNVSAAGMRSSSVYYSGGMYLAVILPVKKGDVFMVEYNAAGTTNAFRFIYAEGEQ